MSNSKIKEILLGVIGIISLIVTYIVVTKWNKEIYDTYEKKLRKMNKIHTWRDMSLQNKKYIKLSNKGD